MLAAVHRTNIYLSATEEAALDARAVADGVSRSDVVRSIVDRSMNLAEDPVLDAALIGAATEIAEGARRISQADPDLQTR